MTALARRSLGHGVKTSTIALRVPDEISIEDYVAVGKQLRQLGGTVQWWLADYAWAGRKRYEWGEAYRDIIGQTGLDYDTIANYAYVAGKVDPSRRREALSFAHHAEVAALAPAEQERLLGEAEAGFWTRDELRLAVRELRGLGSGGRQTAMVTWRLSTPPEQAERLEAAAERAGLEPQQAILTAVEEWVDRTLEPDAAAA